jgi:hypothetical protein
MTKAAQATATRGMNPAAAMGMRMLACSPWREAATGYELVKEQSGDGGGTRVGDGGEGEGDSKFIFPSSLWKMYYVINYIIFVFYKFNF